MTISHVTRFIRGKFFKLILKGGYRFAIFAVCLEIFEHTLLPGIMLHLGQTKLCWIGCTPLDELIIYPLVLKFIFRR